MNWFKVIFCAVLCTFITIPSAFAKDPTFMKPSGFNNVEEIERYLGEGPVYLFKSETRDARGYISGPWHPDSQEGYDPTYHFTGLGEAYILRHEIQTSDQTYGPIVDSKFLVSVPQGIDITLQSSVQVCQSTSHTITIGYSYGISVGGFNSSINKSVGITVGSSVCHTYAENTKFTFPSKCSGYDYADWYGGMQKRVYPTRTDMVPVTRDGTGWANCTNICFRDYKMISPPNDELYRQCMQDCEAYYPWTTNWGGRVSQHGDFHMPHEVLFAVCRNY